jgi:hypothetical protein
MAFLNGRWNCWSRPNHAVAFADRLLLPLAGPEPARVRRSASCSPGPAATARSGVRAIKGEGGMVMAQEPGSTSFDGMPRSAIATGLVDWQLPPAEMPAQIISLRDARLRPAGSAAGRTGTQDRERA